MILLWPVVLLVGNLTPVESAAKYLNSTTEQLFKNLFDEYNRAIRPTVDGTRTTIYVMPHLYSIIEVKEMDETVRLSRWLQLYWLDPALTWDPDDFGGKEEILVESEYIWLPDVTVLEMLERQAADLPREYVAVRYDGNVRYSVNDIITVYCSIDAYKFPYDEQRCSMSYVSWAHPSDEIEVNAKPDPNHGYLFFYGNNSEWDLLSFDTFDPDAPYTNNDTISFNYVRFYLNIRRKPTFYVLGLVIPCFLITLLSLIGIFSPTTSTHERGERIQIGLTATLAMSVVLMIVTDIMPKSDDAFPILGQYMLSQMVLTTLATCLAVVIMYIQGSSALGQDLPEWLLKVTFTDHDKPYRDDKWKDNSSGHQNGHPFTSAHTHNSYESHYHSRSHKDRDDNYSTEVQKNLVRITQRIQRVCEKVDAQIEDQREADARGEASMRLCFKLDLIFNFVFNLANVIITIVYCG